MPAILALGRLRLQDHCEFKAKLGYAVNSRPGCIARPCLKKIKKNETIKDRDQN